MSLPELVVFSVRDSALGSRYLSFTGPQRQLRCDPEEGVFSDLASFVVEPAENGLVHIRSRYENRYWVKASRFEPWLLSSALEPVEDQYDEGCTLFRPALAAGSVSVSFIHVHSGLNVAMRPEADSEAYNLCVEQAAPTDFNFINPSTSLIKLPNYVAIRADNNMYLYQQDSQGPSILTFNDNLRTVILPTHTKNGHDIRIKTTGIHDRFGRFVRPQEEVWFLRPNIHPELDLNDPLLLFQVVRSSPPGTNQVGIALRSRANNNFCKRQGIVLVANATSQHDPLAWLRLEDPASNRLVTVTSFRNARVTRQDKIVLSTTVTNKVEGDAQVGIPVIIQDTHKRTWSHSFVPLLAKTVGVFNARIPSFTTSGQLVFPDAPTNVMGAWLETTDLTQQRNTNIIFTVPASSKAILRLVQSVAICHVPFSYRQEDTLKLPFGRKVQYDLDDGFFILEYAYDLRQQVVPLTTEEFDAQVALEQDAAFNQGSDAQGGMEPDTTNNESSDDMMKQDADQLAEKIRQIFSAQDEMKPDASNDSDYQQGQGSEAEEDMIPEASHDQASDAQEEMKPEQVASDKVDDDN